MAKTCTEREFLLTLYIDMFIVCMYCRCGALVSLEGLVHYLGLHITPEDPAFCPQHRAQLCYVAHVISVVLKNKAVSSDKQAGTNTQSHVNVRIYV